MSRAIEQQQQPNRPFGLLYSLDKSHRAFPPSIFPFSGPQLVQLVG